jgi:hypothetical protein
LSGEIHSRLTCDSECWIVLEQIPESASQNLCAISQTRTMKYLWTWNIPYCVVIARCAKLNHFISWFIEIRHHCNGRVRCGTEGGRDKAARYNAKRTYLYRELRTLLYHTGELLCIFTIFPATLSRQRALDLSIRAAVGILVELHQRLTNDVGSLQSWARVLVLPQLSNA